MEATGRRLCDAPLKRREDGSYDMDLAAIEKHLQQGAKLMLLCSPHNPVSRAWTRQELTALMELLHRYGAFLASDEIHADFVFAPGEFVPILSVTQEKVLSFCAASKTFNLAGLQQAACICPDAAVREAFQREKNRAGVTCGNIFALEATRAAYEHGDAWLDGLMDYLAGNRDHLAALVKAHLPRAVMTPMTATYLAWIDLTAYGFSEEELKKRADAAGVVFTMGRFFGDAGDGFVRVNIGCPRRYITEGVLRLKKALEV